MANIQFKQVILHNFLSYEYANIQLDVPGFIMVSGENNSTEDLAKSNGCGKSTIFNAIIWALFGQTISGAKNVQNIYTNGKCSVELCFVYNGLNFKIIRFKSPSNLQIFINDEDKSGKGVRDSEKLLEEYLPDLTKSMLTSVIILGQGLPQRFTSNTPTGRKEVLEKLAKSDFMVEDIKSKLATRKDFLEKSLRQNEDKLINNKTKVQLLENQKKEFEDKLKFLPSEEVLISELNNLQNTKTGYEYNIHNIEISIKELTNKRTNYYDFLLSLQEDKNSKLLSLDTSAISELDSLVSETQIEINLLKQEKQEKDNITDICPTCGQKLIGVHKVDTTELENRINDLQEDLILYSQNLENAIEENNSEKNDIIQEYENNIIETENKKKEIEFQLELVNQTFTNLSNKLEQINKEIAVKDFQLKSLKDTEKEVKDKLSSINSELINLQEENIVINNEVTYLISHIDINSKMTALAKKEFRSFLLEEIVSFISQKCKEYSIQVFGTSNLLFELDKNSIKVSYANKEYELLSGGEKQKVDIILQLAIRDMLCAYLNFSSNILVLDEITDALDSVGAQNIFNLISNNLTDVETIYIISHHSDYSIPVDRVLRVVKGDDNISVIESS